MLQNNILLVTPVGTHPTISGNAIRPIYLAKQLVRLGYTPHLAYTDFGSGDLAGMRKHWGAHRFHYIPFRRGSPRWEIKRILRRIGLANTSLSHWWRSRTAKLTRPHRMRPRLDSYYDEAMTPWLRSLHARYRFDAVIAHFVILSRALEAFPEGTPRILDTQEVFAVGREEASARGERYWIDVTRDDEILGLKHADYIWTSQQHEQESLRPYLGDRVLTVSHFIDPLETVPESSLKSRNVIFVGGNHPANCEGLRWFGREVYPFLSSWLAAENIVIVGKVKNAVGREFPFRFLGPVDDLAAVYRDSRIAICPIQFGTGLKSKNVEAFAFAKPVVTTSFGRLGMEDGDRRAHLVADLPTEFAEALRRLMTDDTHCRMMMHGALTYAKEWNERLSGPMLECLKGIR